jgi:hypothetical protein
MTSFIVFVIGMKITKITTWKQPRLQDFLNEGENKGMSNLKSRLWNKKIRKKTWHVWNKNPKKNYYMKEIKTEQSYNKKKILKTGVE